MHRRSCFIASVSLGLVVLAGMGACASHKESSTASADKPAMAAPAGSTASGSTTATEVAVAARQRHFSVTYDAKVANVPAGTKQLRVWIPAPRNSDPAQDVLSAGIETSAGGAVRDPARDSSGENRVWCVTYTDPKPEVTARVTMDVRRRELLNNNFRGAGLAALNDGQKEKLAVWLHADRLVPIDGKVAQIAATVAAKETNTVNLARGLYDYVRGHMEYKKTGTGWGKGDTMWACDNGYGNCTDFHSLFISMGRSRGLPVRFLMGLSIPPERGAGAIGGYHCWAEFFTPDLGWVPVDISEAGKHPEMAQYYFGALTEDRVSFTLGRDLELSPMPAAGKLNFLIYPYAEADGKPIAATQTMAYKDL